MLNSGKVPLQSMNRLNQTESATFAIVLFWDFFRGFIFSIFYIMVTGEMLLLSQLSEM